MIATDLVVAKAALYLACGASYDEMDALDAHFARTQIPDTPRAAVAQVRTALDAIRNAPVRG